jgi:GNAT superfamily N-acetyltransferase
MDNALLIRQASLEDLSSIAHLTQLLFEHHGDLDDSLSALWIRSEEGMRYLRNRITKHVVFVACDGPQAVGYLAGEILPVPSYRTIETLAELQNMFVVDGWRSRGVGTMLIQTFCDWCAGRGIERIKVEVLAANPEAVEFYKRAGFRERVLTLERRQDDHAPGPEQPA